MEKDCEAFGAKQARKGEWSLSEFFAWSGKKSMFELNLSILSI